MTTTTVEVEQTITKEEEITLCDECQREVDENGETFLPPDMSSPQLHFCSECLEQMTDGEVQPEYVKRAEDWLNTSSVLNDMTIEDELYSVKQATGYISILSVGAGLFIGAIAISPYTLPFSGILIPCYITCLLGAILLNHFYYNNAFISVRNLRDISG